LKKLFDFLHSINCFVVMSNSNEPEIVDMFNSYNINIISVKRFINSKVSERNISKTELLITNF
jgi:site-specific DNA-adenine methylase